MRSRRIGPAGLLLVVLIVGTTAAAMLISDGAAAAPALALDSPCPSPTGMGPECTPASPTDASPSPTDSTPMPCGGLRAATHKECEPAPNYVTIEYRKGHFMGLVGDQLRRCRVGRKVLLFRIRHRHKRLIGFDRTSNEGAWHVLHPHAHGKFFARTRTQDVGEPGRPLVCSGDRSPTIHP